jgi:DNA adenine methylase
MKSPIIYYGGKTSMLPIILPMIPEHHVYTEVFFGGGAVFFAKRQVKNETINDRLDLVVNFYRQIKLNFDLLNREIQTTLFSRTLHNKALLIIRNKDLFSPVELAWAFWMCSNFSYGNKIGGGLKYSNDQSILPPNVLKNNKEAFTSAILKRIELTIIENKEAIEILESRNVPKAFHYIDPPYPGADQGHYSGYSFDEFEILLKWLETCKGKFLLSNYDSDMLQRYIEKNKWQSSMHTFNNKGMRKNDRKKFEVLIWNYDLPQKTMF